jgi:hypothetical protein
MKKVCIPALTAILITAAIVYGCRPATAPVQSQPDSTQESPLTQAGPRSAPPGALPLRLSLIGEQRKLPVNLLGASVEPFYDNVLQDTRKIAAVNATKPAILRFPGGTQSNYYNWRTGLFSFEAKSNSSAYFKFWADLAPRLARTFPQGVSMEDYAPFADKVGAGIVLVPNLETSSIEEQTAWFNKLASKHILPRDIELGNEFWVATGGDPNVMRIWPDEKSSMAVMQQYTSALRPIVGPGAKFAVQASGSSFNLLPNDPRPFYRRLQQWDEDLKPADWFEAVTAHFYPEIDVSAIAGNNPAPSAVFAIYMGRQDTGIDRALNDIAVRVPGKEIWITEWNPRSAMVWDPVHTERVTPDMSAHLVARTTLAILRHPEVTKSIYFMLTALNNYPLQSYVAEDGQFLPMPAAIVLSWFNQAANGGSTFQRAVDPGEKPAPGLQAFNESYLPVEAGWFTSAKQTTLILQNASAQERWCNPAQMGPKTGPAHIERITAADFSGQAHKTAVVETVDKTGPLVMPPYSMARIIWD